MKLVTKEVEKGICDLYAVDIPAAYSGLQTIQLDFFPKQKDEGEASTLMTRRNFLPNQEQVFLRRIAYDSDMLVRFTLVGSIPLLIAETELIYR